MCLGRVNKKFVFDNNEVVVRIFDCMENDKPVQFSLDNFLQLTPKNLLSVQNFLKSNWEDIDERYGDIIRKLISKMKDTKSEKYTYLNNILNKRDPYYSGEHIEYKGGATQAGVSRTGYIYLLYIEKFNIYKIGKTTDMNARMNTFGVKFPADFVIVHSYKNNSYSQEEKRLHKMFKNKMIKERSEWFDLNKEDVKYICSLRDYE